MLTVRCEHHLGTGGEITAAASIGSAGRVCHLQREKFRPRESLLEETEAYLFVRFRILPSGRDAEGGEQTNAPGKNGLDSTLGAGPGDESRPESQNSKHFSSAELLVLAVFPTCSTVSCGRCKALTSHPEVMAAELSEITYPVRKHGSQAGVSFPHHTAVPR